MRSDPTLMYLDVLRGGKVVVVRVLVVREALEEHIDRDRYRDHMDMMQKWGDRAIKQITKNGNPSGVTMDLFFPPLATGDIIRKIDGVAVATPADATAALAQTVDHAEVSFEIERLGKPLIVKIVLDTPVSLDPSLLSKIKKTGGNTYEIDKDVIDAVIQNPMAVAKGARVVPAVKDGKPIGFKLYAIRSTSVFAALGLANGDTILSVNGNALTTADKALEVYTKIREAKKLVVNLEREGKTMTLTYTIKN
jgi:S1-C subfamily serine protease